MQADPLGLVDGASIYGYSLQNPGRYTDPTGEFAWGLAFGAAALLYELYTNNWDIRCVNWINVGLSTFGGAGLNALRTGAFNRGFTGQSFSGIKQYMNRHGLNPKRRSTDQYHHWFFEQNQGLGRNIPRRFKNQIWNLNPVSRRFNQFMNKYSRYGASFLGAPGWAKEMSGGLLLTLGGQGCDCEIE